MSTFKFIETDYNIVEEKKGETERGFWEEKITDVLREREIFAYRPWWIGKKFRWLKKIKIKEVFIIERHTEFDDGWSYMNLWLPWKGRWEAIEILT